jgi:hypothetical protein
MKFPTVPIEFIDWPPPVRLRSDEIVQGERWNEDIATLSSDPESGFAPDCQIFYVQIMSLDTKLKGKHDNLRFGVAFICIRQRDLESAIARYHAE